MADVHTDIPMGRQMPWTTDDVEGHVKGLTAEQKAAWVKIANQTLADCGSGADCEGKAIRVANAAAQRVGKIAKVDAAQGRVYGWANVVVDADGEEVTDLQGDRIAPDEMDNAMVDFMLSCRDAGEMHEGEAQGRVFESVVITPTKLAAMGFPEDVVKNFPSGTWIGVQMDPASEAFRKVQAGEYRMFSIQGAALSKTED